jgi:thiamine phosphate synthase YjbQ (UPF0047 family)
MSTVYFILLRFVPSNMNRLALGGWEEGVWGEFDESNHIRIQMQGV